MKRHYPADLGGAWPLCGIWVEGDTVSQTDSDCALCQDRRMEKHRRTYGKAPIIDCRKRRSNQTRG
jgi:hypothetical protein